MTETQTTTVTKLKALLEALDLMNEEEDWIPTGKQWTRIKGMIETLEEVVAVAPAPSTPTYRQTNTNARPASTTVVHHNPNSPNPAESGQVVFPEVPVGEAPVLTPKEAATSALNQPVDNQLGNPVSSADDEIPEAPPGSPGL